jgi:hypothetical protein
MSRFNPKESGYVEVKDRVVEFYAKHPQGSLQSEVVLFNENVVVMKAFAFRSPEDTRPGVGHSQMQIPGPTTFTKGSEIENAETSAIGRAIAALGFSVHRSYASANEIENKSTEGVTQPANESAQHTSDPVASKALRDALVNLATELGLEKKELTPLRKSHTDKASPAQFTAVDVANMERAIRELAAVKKAAGPGAEVVA